MTTTTAPDVIEGIDMEAVPVCESKYGCDAVAAWVWVKEKSHPCRQLVCNHHRDVMVNFLATRHYPQVFECSLCGRRSPLRYSPSEVGRWVAL